jgi:hypothetical protein
VSIEVGGLVTGELDGEAARAGDVSALNAVSAVSLTGRSGSDALAHRGERSITTSRAQVIAMIDDCEWRLRRAEAEGGSLLGGGTHEDVVGHH